MQFKSEAVEVNDEVIAIGQQGRFVVLKIDGSTAEVQLFGDHRETGERFYFEKTQFPISVLSVIGKNHKRPPTAKTV